MEDRSDSPKEDEWHGDHANQFDRLVSKEVQDRALDRVRAHRRPTQFRGIGQLQFENVGNLFRQKQVRG